MDVTNSASYIVRVILQIRAAGSACPDPKAWYDRGLKN